MKTNNFDKDQIFTYNEYRKKIVTIASIILFISLAGLLAIYIILNRGNDSSLLSYLTKIVSQIFLNIKDGTLLGAVYAGSIGGLFFVFMPLEALYINFLRSGNNPYLVLTLYICGMILSYSINYFIGLKLAGVSKKLIGLKKFYKIKGTINKYGALAVFVFNALPLPSQPLSTILGVFKYNKVKFYVFFISGQFIKYLIITIGYFYIT